jgi:hypothetical protein
MSDAFVSMNASLVSMNDAFVRTKCRYSVRFSELNAEDRRRESGDGSVPKTEPTELHQKWGMGEESVCFFGGTVFKSSVFKSMDAVTRSTTWVVPSLGESGGAG